MDGKGEKSAEIRIFLTKILGCLAASDDQIRTRIAHPFQPAPNLPETRSMQAFRTTLKLITNPRGRLNKFKPLEQG